MKTTLLLLVGFLAGISGVSAQTGTPAQPEPLTVKLGISGRPPSFIYSNWPADADQVQIEVVIETSAGTDKPVARVFIDPTTCFVNPITISGQHKTEVFIRGTGLTGFAMFYAVGQYKVHWRGYNDQSEFGPWSEFTPFTRVFTSRTVTRITRGLSRVTTDKDVMFQWKNDFVDEVYALQILYGRRAIRNQYGRGSFRDGWMYEGSYTYRDRPESPDDELPNSSYVFKVRAWCPITRSWSAWAQKSFVVARGVPRAPSIMVTQRDFNGWFNRSSRPRFLARYGSRNTPALWTQYDIRRLVNGRQRRVILKWVSRYTSAKDGAGIGSNRGEICLRGEKIFYDLPPGTYIWRVRAHGGHTQWWDGSRRRNLGRWTAFRTNVLAAPGGLAQPITTSMNLRNGSVCEPGFWEALDPARPEYLSWHNPLWSLQGKIVWRTVRKAFVYNLLIYRNNEFYMSHYGLDPRIHNCRMSSTGRTMMFTRDRFPSGTYRFRVQAYNRANTPSIRKSAWSDLSPEFIVP